MKKKIPVAIVWLEPGTSALTTWPPNNPKATKNAVLMKIMNAKVIHMRPMAVHQLYHFLTHTGTGAKLVEEAVDKNRRLFIVICKVARWHHIEADQGTEASDQDIPSTLGFSRTLSSRSSPSTLDQSGSESHN